MKNIKFIPLFLIAFSMIISSCAIDDDDALVGQTIITKTVSFADSEILVPASDTPYDIAVLISQAFDSNALIEYTVNGVTAGATIPFGNATGGLPIDISEVGTIYEVIMTDISVLEKPDNVDAVIGSSTVKVIVVPPSDPTALVVFMDWNNPGNQNDLDLHISADPPPVLNGFFGPFIDTLESSLSVSPTENVSFANTYPDGTYNILPQDYSSVDDPIDINIYVIHPNGSVDAFSGAIENGSGYNYFIKFDKVGDTYTATQVPTEPVDLG